MFPGESPTFSLLYIYSLFLCLTFLLQFCLQSFITQDSRDRDLLVKNFKSFDIPVLNYVGNGSDHGEPFQVSDEVCYEASMRLCVTSHLYFLSLFFFFFGTL